MLIIAETIKTLIIKKKTLAAYRRQRGRFSSYLYEEFIIYMGNYYLPQQQQKAAAEAAAKKEEEDSNLICLSEMGMDDSKF